MKYFISHTLKPIPKWIELIEEFNNSNYEIDNSNFIILDFGFNRSKGIVTKMGAIQFKVQDNTLIVEKIIFCNYNNPIEGKFIFPENIDFLSKLIAGRHIIVHNGALEREIITKNITPLHCSSWIDINDFNLFDTDEYINLKEYAKKCKEINFSQFKKHINKNPLFDCLVIFQVFWEYYE